VNQILVAGNGESRAGILLSDLNFETIIGCNAIFRYDYVDHLVCCDKRMVEEAIDHLNAEHSKIYVRDRWYHYYRKVMKDKRIHTVPDVPYTPSKRPDDPFHWGSGPYAVLLAAQEEINADEIFLLGFDLYSNRGKVNNLFKGTKNYADPGSRPVDPSYWTYQISKVIKLYKSKKFIIVNHPRWNMPKEWQFRNSEFMPIQDFNNTYCKYVKYAL